MLLSIGENSDSASLRRLFAREPHGGLWQHPQADLDYETLVAMSISKREPRWPAFLAMMSAAGVFWALPEPLSLGPGWLLLAKILVLMIPIVITNILVFALWYWKLDAGGPLGRDHSRCKIASAFLFPQLSSDRENYDGWSPHFLDYLFVAFNTSTAFSPTDTAVLARWAKLATMLQSLISLSILVLLAARAVNIL